MTARTTTDARATHSEALGRRTFLVAAGSATVLAACGSGSSRSATTDTATTQSAATADTATGATTGSAAGAPPATECLVPPAETSGPFPSDGSNSNGSGATADALHDTRCVRRDIRSNFDGTDTQSGTPFSLTVYVNDSSCAPLVGAAVYVWHCNEEGAYSGYSSPMIGGDFTDATWLRGVQVVDQSGTVTFDTILPGRYSGRAAHIHFEVFADESLQQSLLISQMAFDDDLVDSLYEQAGYASSLQHDTDNGRDRIFADGVDQQLLTITGDGATALTAAIRVAV